MDAIGRPAGRLLFAALLAVMIAFQGWTIQTHMHGAGYSGPATIHAAAGKPQKSVPANDDPAKCPICQEMLHSGLFVAPAWLVSFLIVASGFLVAPVLFAAPAFAPLSHGWRSRGPPRR